MTINLSDVREAVASQIASVTGLPHTPYPPGTIVVPCGIVLPSQGMSVGWEVVQEFPDGSAANFMLRDVILVSTGSDRDSTALLDSYLATTGATSVKAALEADPTCGGVLSWAHATAVSRYGMVDWGGITYLSADITITASAE